MVLNNKRKQRIRGRVMAVVATFIAAALLAACDNRLLDAVNETRSKAISPIISLSLADGTSIQAGGTVDFGSVGIGKSVNANMTVSNSGESNLLLTSESISFVPANGQSDIGFSVIGVPAEEIAPGASAILSLRFIPRAAGAVSQTITIVTNDVVNGTLTLVCKGTGITLGSSKLISSFGFIGYPSAGVSIGDSAITVVLPVGTDKSNLRATFAITGVSINIDGVVQQSAITSNDFSGPVTFTVVAEDDSTKDYIVNVDSNGVQVGFDANGGIGTMESQTVTPNTTITLNNNSFSRTGYSFDGWATTSGGSIAYTDGQNVLIGPGGLALFARWKTNTYKVTFLPNIPSLTGTYSAWTGTTGTMSDQSFDYDTTANLTNCGYARTGYSFAGWTPNPNSATPTVLANMASYTIGAGNVNLFATWQSTGAYTLGSTGPGGGKIIHDKGSYSDGWRYLEAAPRQAGGIPWCGSSWIYVYAATSSAIGAGKQNTKAIIDELGLSFSYGARYCAEYVSNSYNDWFMPSRDEVQAIKTVVNDIVSYTGIWSSTLSDTLWAMIGNDGVSPTSGWGFGTFRTSADNPNYFQRPVRRF